MGIQETPAESIFSAVLLMDSEADRARYLDKACGNDAELRAQIERLLKAHPIVGNFLASPPSGLGLTATIGAADFSVRETPGTVIGPYKLLQQIGEGGMGVVFLAEQTHPVRRQVALKVIKAGMDTRQVVGRFEAERQALALMDHPNIAKVLDAGATDSGRPYFVMELVKGVPITRYCDEHRLTPRDRLALFVQVCQAVQHAHTKGIIHRDLKPSNVMIALYDGRPVPKVIDFGVAKATGGRLTEATLFTGFGAVVGTPEYMSPEQAELNQLDIDTRSDVYSLGVILYELLTGSTPLERKQLNAAALMEVLRVVREQDPPRPSTRLSTTDKLANIAASRGLEPRKLGLVVRGELDWIVMRALEKDRNRRYETANGFAMDVQRYLADEPVQACPPSTTYRFRKFARRNKAALLTVVVVMAALVGGTTVSTWQAVRATRATRSEQAALKIAKAHELAATESAKRADAERKRAEDAFYKARVAVNNVVNHAAMGIGKWSGMPKEYRKIIAADALKYYESLMQTNNADPAVRYETGVALGNVGLMHWRFGETEQAAKLYRQSVDVLDALVRDVPRPPEYRQQCAFNHLQLGRTLKDLHPANEPEKELRIAMALYEGLLSETPGRLNISDELTECYKQLVALIAPASEAQALYRKMVVCAEGACQPFMPPNRLATRPADQAHREALALDDIATCLVRAPASVSRDHQAVIRIGRAVTELEPGYVGGWTTLAVGHYLAGDWNAAEAAVRNATDRLEKSYAATPTSPALYKLVLDCVNLMEAMTAEKDPQLRLAEQVYREALKVTSGAPAELRANPDVRRQIGHIHRFWAFALEDADRVEEAEKAFNDAQGIFDKLVTDDPGLAGNWHYAADTRFRLAMFMSNRGRKQEAEQTARRAIEIHEMREAKFPNYNDTSRNRERSECYKQLAWMLATAHAPQQRDPAYAVKLAAKAVKIEPTESSLWTVLGIAHYRAGKWKDAVEALEKSSELPTAKAAGAAGHNGLFLAMAHWRLDEKDESRKCYDRAVAWIEKNKPEDKRLKEFRAEAMELLGAGAGETKDQQKTTGR